jgi:tetratricopeptide (TPR) repeat protein
MKRVLAALAAVAFLAATAAAQSKLDQAIAKADEQLAKGKPDDAVKTLAKAAADTGAEGLIALGRLQERLGNLDAATEAYTQAKAAAMGSRRADVLAAVANFTLRRGKAADAMAIAREAVQAGATPASLAAMARAQVRMGDGPGALATAQKAVAAGAKSAIAQVALGEALIAMGKNAEAEAALQKAVQLDPKSALAYSRLARAQLALGKPAEAVASAEKATQVGDKFGEGFAMLGVAMVAEDPKAWSVAIAQAQQGAFLDPDDPDVQNAVGKIFEANGQLEQAAKAYRRALAADPGYGPARFALIQSELSRGNRDAAIQEAGDLGENGAMGPDIARLIGEDAVRRQDYTGAIPFLEHATKGLPGNPDGWALLGRAYHATGRYEDAAEAYKKAAQLAPQNLDYRSTLGLILGQAGHLDAGLAELLKVTSTPGYKDAAGWTNLGWIYRTLKRSRKSIAAYAKALELDPKQEQAALGLGWAYSNMKDYDKAIAAYNKAIQIDAKEAGPDAHVGIAWGYFFKSVKSASKQDVGRAKEFAAKAAADGRDVTQLNRSIALLEKALANGKLLSHRQVEAARQLEEEYEQEKRKLDAASSDLGSKVPAARIRGLNAMVKTAGASAVPTVIPLMQADPSYDVRIAACRAIGSLGPAARQALPTIDGILRQAPYDPGPNPTPEKLRTQTKDGDYRRCLRDAKAAIGR